MTRRRALTALALIPVALSVGCSLGQDTTPSDLRMLIPNTPGGGYDVTARTVARILENNDLSGPIEKFNVVGGGGSVALARLMRESANDRLLAMVGLGVVGAALVDGSPWGLSDTTALARLVDEPEALIVRSTSPFGSVGQFVDAWRANPSALTIGVGSAVGGPDYVFSMELARAVGVDAVKLDIVEYAGAGDLLAAALDGTVDVAFAGAGEYIDQVAAGSLRLLAVSNSSGDNPSLVESGIDLEFTNWRGFVAPPGISESTRVDLVDMLRNMHNTKAWRLAVVEHGWTDSFLAGEEFTEFLAAEDRRMTTALDELGVPR